MTVLILILVVVGLFIFIAIYGSNSIVHAKVRVDAAWAQIDVQLQRRMDLIGNLVETVKGYASHEKSTLEAVINARAKALSSSTPATSATTASETSKLATRTDGTTDIPGPKTCPASTGVSNKILTGTR